MTRSVALLHAIWLFGPCAILPPRETRAGLHWRTDPGSREPAPHDPPTQEERRRVRKTTESGMERRRALLGQAMLQPGASVDVQRYVLDARAVVEDLATLGVDLYDAMGVTSIVTGATPPAVNDFVTYAFAFDTHPPSGSAPIIWSLSEPGYAPTWWPSSPPCRRTRP